MRHILYVSQFILSLEKGDFWSDFRSEIHKVYSYILLRSGCNQMRKLSILTRVSILVVSVASFKLSGIGTAGLRRWNFRKNIVHPNGGLQYVNALRSSSTLAGWTDLLPNLKDESQLRKVHAVLTFHRLMTALLPHTNWLGLAEDPKGPVSLHQHSVPTATPSSRPWDLSRLPIVHANGGLRDVDDLRNSITHDDGTLSTARQGKPGSATKSAKEDKKSYCRPELLGEYLNCLSNTEFHAFSTGVQSSSADFIVRYGKNVTHLHVKDIDIDHVSFRLVLEVSGKVAPTAEASSKLQHTLAFVNEKSDVRTKMKQMVGQLSGVELAQKLEDELKNVEAEDGKKEGRKPKEIKDDKAKRQRMQQAIDLIREGTLKVEVLDDIQYKRFMRNYELAKQLVDGIYPR